MASEDILQLNSMGDHKKLQWTLINDLQMASEDIISPTESFNK